MRHVPLRILRLSTLMIGKNESSHRVRSASWPATINLSARVASPMNVTRGVVVVIPQISLMSVGRWHECFGVPAFVLACLPVFNRFGTGLSQTSENEIFGAFGTPFPYTALERAKLRLAPVRLGNHRGQSVHQFLRAG